MLYWYELKRHDGQAEFVRHEIDNHSGVGTQFEVTDINGDGLLDIAVANKSGVYVFRAIPRLNGEHTRSRFAETPW